MRKNCIITVIVLLLISGVTALSYRFVESFLNIKTVEDYTIFLLDAYTPESDSTYDKANFGWNTEGSRNNWTYFNGIMMLAFAKEPVYMFMPRNFYFDILTTDGKVNNTARKANMYIEGELDSILPARTLFLLDYKSNPKFEKALDYTYSNLKKQKTLPKLGNNFIHKEDNKDWERYPVALDSLYMALPFYAEYTNKSEKLSKHEKHENFKDIFKKMDWVSKNMRAHNGLYYHGVSADGKLPNRIVWLRAVGWYAMAQVDVIEQMPDGDNKDKMIEQYKSFIDSMLQYQDKKTGMWKNVIHPYLNFECNIYETSGTLMVAYSILKAYNDGYLKDRKYLNAGLKAYNNTVKEKLKKDVSGYILSDIYLISGVNEQPEKYCKCNGYRTNEAKGIAPLLLCTQEVKRYYHIK